MIEPAARAAIRVLLVEDNPGDARLILEMLREVGEDVFDLEQVERLEGALERLGGAGIDIVLLDLGLPDSQGLATFERARRMAPNEPIVVISGLDDEEMALAAVRSGAQDYLVKGRIEGQLLARVIRHAIERNRAEAALADRERWFRALVERSWDVIAVLDGQGTIVYASPATTRILGYPLGEFVDRSLFDFVEFDDRPLLATALRESLRRPGEQVTVQARVRHEGGSLRLTEGVLTNFLHDAGIQGIVFNYRDVTDREQAEKARHDAAVRLRSLMDNANDGIAVLSPEGIVLEVNRKMTEILDRPPEQIVGAQVDEFSPPGASGQRAEIWKTIALGSGEVQGVRIVRPDGDVVIVDFSYSVIDIGDDRVVLTIGRDVTRQRALEEQLRQSQKLEAVGRLAGGVAHDFNNILTAILGTSELLLRRLEPSDTRREDVDTIRDSAQRAAALTRQLLAFSRQQVLEPRRLNLNQLITNLDRMLRRIIPEDIELRTRPAAQLGIVRADAGQLEQVILNLAVNARDAMPRGGTLTIETGNAELDEIYAEGHVRVEPGRYVMLAVSDNGAGIDPAAQNHMFEPFFTTKPIGKGTGLGLATVYGTVKQSGGYIWVYSEPGKGTTFKIYLPRVDAPADSLVPTPVEAGSLEGSETILVVEDEQNVRNLMRRMLETLGYRVLAASSGKEALRIAGEHAGPIPLVISDVVMPEMSGRELEERLAEARPEAKVMFVSGYTDETVVHHGVIPLEFRFLQKPFTFETLARRVREALDSETG